jgi:O-antigen/teichoic acid export membrane protein
VIAKIKHLFSSDLIKVSSLNAVSTVIKMLTGLVSVKVVAAVIGPGGIALLGQLNNFSTITLGISSGGINTGITKYISENCESRNKYLLYLGTGFWITIFFSIIASLVLIVGAGYFSSLILHDIKYTYVFYFFGATVILYALNALLISVINGFKDYKKYIIANIVGSVTGLVFSVILAISYGIPGALISAVTFQSIVFLLTLFIINKSYWFEWKIFTGKFSKLVAGRLGHYSLMALVSAIAVPAAQLIVRGYITKTQSISSAGLWEGVNRISVMYLLAITTSLSVYFLPRLAELRKNKEIRKEILNVYKLIIPALIFATLLIYMLRKVIIQVLFTKEFSGMLELFKFQLIGDIFKMSGWVLGYLMLAKAMIKTYIIMEIVSFCLQVFLSLFFISFFGTIGATIGYATGHLVYFLVMLIIFRKILFSHE